MCASSFPSSTTSDVVSSSLRPLTLRVCWPRPSFSALSPWWWLWGAPRPSTSSGVILEASTASRCLWFVRSLDAASHFVQRELQEVVGLSVRHAAIFERCGVSPSKNLLLYGPPGVFAAKQGSSAPSDRDSQGAARRCWPRPLQQRLAVTSCLSSARRCECWSLFLTFLAQGCAPFPSLLSTNVPLVVPGVLALRPRC